MQMPDDTVLPPPGFAERCRWFLRGASNVASVPGLILCTAHIGFADLAQQAGITMAQAVFMVGIIWALPGMVVLVGAVLSGVGLLGTAFAVALSSVRLTPMVVSLVPELRGSRTRKLTLYLLAHFIAITSWVIAMETIRAVPRDVRTSYYFGLGSILVVTNMIVVAIVFAVAAALPPAVAAGLFLLTPMYFLTSLGGRRANSLAYRHGARPRARPAHPHVRAGLRPARRRAGRRRACLRGASDQGPLGMTLGSIDAWWWPYLFIVLAGWAMTIHGGRSASIGGYPRDAEISCSCAPSRPRWWRRSSAISSASFRAGGGDDAGAVYFRPRWGSRPTSSSRGKC